MEEKRVMHIQSFDEHDRQDLIALWHACGLTRPWNDPDADINRAILGAHSTILVGHVDAAVVASAMVGEDGHRGWIYYLGVAPTHRGRGLANQMMDAACDWLRALGVPKVELMVRTDNAAATTFYDRLGFERQNVVTYGRWLDR
ncbi:MAG: GNAT family acetyltransferase [Pseudomonadota bacterium]